MPNCLVPQVWNVYGNLKLEYPDHYQHNSTCLPDNSDHNTTLSMKNSIQIWEIRHSESTLSPDKTSLGLSMTSQNYNTIVVLYV